VQATDDASVAVWGFDNTNARKHVKSTDIGATWSIVTYTDGSESLELVGTDPQWKSDQLSYQ
jgi:hypothetical protein